MFQHSLSFKSVQVQYSAIYHKRSCLVLLPPCLSKKVKKKEGPNLVKVLRSLLVLCFSKRYIVQRGLGLNEFLHTAVTDSEIPIIYISVS